MRCQDDRICECEEVQGDRDQNTIQKYTRRRRFFLGRVPTLKVHLFFFFFFQITGPFFSRDFPPFFR